MNTIDKIIRDSKTQKQAAEMFQKLSEKLGEPVNAADALYLIRGYKIGKRDCLTAADFLLKKEAKYDRELMKARLQEYHPTVIISKAIEGCDKDLRDWAEEFLKDPFYKLSWGDAIVKTAAKRFLYLEIQSYLNNQTYADLSTAFPLWEEIQEHIKGQALRMAATPASSTSKISNFAEECKMAAYAEACRGYMGDSVCSEISYWFREKAKYEKGDDVPA
jgi:hypothetical protein